MDSIESRLIKIQRVNKELLVALDSKVIFDSYTDSVNHIQLQLNRN